MLEVFIEGNKLDINEEFSMLMTYAIDDIKDFGAKNTTFSKTVILPGTKNNNKLFGNIFDASVSNDYNPSSKNIGINFNASVSASVVVFNNNIQVMKGILQLLEIVYDDSFIEYEVGLFGELAGFTAALGASLLTENMNTDGTPNTALDLDFSAYNQTYSLANIVASKSNIGSGAGVVYPLIDYGTYGRNSAHTSFGKHSWIYKTFRPALFIKEYIDKIFAKVGYTYDCDLFNTARFKSLIMPHNQKKLGRFSFTAIQLQDTDVSINLLTYTPAQYVPISIIIEAGNFTANSSKTIYTYNGSEEITNCSLSFQFYGLLTSDSRNYIQLGFAIVNDGIVNSLFYDDYYDTISINKTIDGLHFKNGDSFYIFGILKPTYPYGDSAILHYDVDLKITSTTKNFIDTNLGDNIQINDCIPSNILQKDFISSICKLFNLYIFEDPQKDKHLKIAPFVDFFYLASSIDWSYKLDRSKPIKIKPMAELTARYYQFEYKKDSDYWNDLYNKRYNLTYGSYKYDSNFQLSQESQKVDIIFSGTPIVGYQGEDKVYSTIMKRTGTDSAPVEETVDSNIRILQTKLVTGVASWDILADNGTTILGSYTDYPYAGHFDDPDAPTNDLCFGVPNELFFTLLAGTINVNQFNLYWSSYLAEITDKDSKLLTATFKLALKDINNLDFSQLIYIDGSLWRLNKIIDFNANMEDTCSVELVKVINKIY
jgi:hypothetical protein